MERAKQKQGCDARADSQGISEMLLRSRDVRGCDAERQSRKEGGKGNMRLAKRRANWPCGEVFVRIREEKPRRELRWRTIDEKSISVIFIN